MRRRWPVVGLTTLLVVGVVEILVRIAAPAMPDPAPWPTPESRLKASQMEELGCVDVVFLGTSVTEAAVDPSELPFSAYNAALPFSTLESVRYWAEHFVLPELCPQTVVVGIPTWSTGFAAPGGSERLLRGLQGVVEYNQPDTWFAHSELIRRRGQLKSLAEQWTTAFRPERAGLISPLGDQLGYAGRNLAALPPVDPSVVISSVEQSELEELIAVIREAEANVVMMAEPARCDPSGVCPSRSVRSEISRQYEEVATAMGVPVIDVWDRFDPAEYADPSHLNDLGASRFTALLADALALVRIEN